MGRGSAPDRDARRQEGPPKRRRRHALLYSLSDNAVVAHAVLRQLRRGRAPETLDNLPDELSSITLARCQEVARRWLDRAQPSITALGLPLELAPGLDVDVEIRN